MNKVDGTPPSSEMTGEEVQRLQEENLRLRSLLITHGIPIPEVANPTGPPPRISGSESNPKVGTAAQRITLFRSLFRGEKSIRHDQIRRVRLIWILQGRARGPLRLVIEPRDRSGARELDINAKVFSRAAIDAVLELGARVADADDGGLRDGVVMRTLREWKQRHKT